eukprot:TRINITY_DN3890_c0_g2_i2.p1 TRINITY_DN3890_c0_g2~~TRINITY_DN3890_c0_g2_i2.p1  ORF type:complete len:839 (-),score=42.89 TRINITY_DN3890_c0_g2_i2:453-2969(-)
MKMRGSKSEDPLTSLRSDSVLSETVRKNEQARAVLNDDLSEAPQNHGLITWSNDDTILEMSPTELHQSTVDAGGSESHAKESLTIYQTHVTHYKDKTHSRDSGNAHLENFNRRHLRELSGKDKRPIPGAAVKSSSAASALRSTITCQGEFGEWQFNSTPRILPWPREVYEYSTGCDDDTAWIEEMLKGKETGGGEKAGVMGEEAWKRVPDSMKWEWKRSDNCFWEEFNYERFCRAMHEEWGRHAQVVIVGGEHMFALERRFFATMVASRPAKAPMVALFPAQFQTGPRNPTKTRSGMRYCFDVLAGESITVRYYRNRNLTIEQEDAMPGDTGLKTAMRRSQTPAVVLNLEQQDIPIEDFEARLTRAINQIRKTSSKDVLIIYMATPIAPQCTGPALQNYSRMENVSPYAQAFKLQNVAAKKIAKSHGAIFIDPNPSLDAWTRKDKTVKRKSNGRLASCVNGCLPGVADAWVALLNNALLLALKGESKIGMNLQVPGMQNRPSQTKEINDKFFESRSRMWESKMAEVRISDNVEEEGVLHIQAYKFEVSRFPPKLKALVPGSKSVRSVKGWKEVQSKLECQATKGRWVYNDTPRVLPWSRGANKEVSACDIDHEKQGGLIGEKANQVAQEGGKKWNVREALKWEWQTGAECPFEYISREDICRILGPGRQIFMVGDSITESFYHSFYNKLLEGRDLERYPVERLPSMVEWEVNDMKSCFGIANACAEFFQESVTVRYCASDWLTLNMMPVQRHTAWATKLKEWNPSIVHLNAGAHPLKDAELVETSRQALFFVRSTLPSALIVWRTTVPGHKDCANYSGPISTRQDPQTLPYHWDEFSH